MRIGFSREVVAVLQQTAHMHFCVLHSVKNAVQGTVRVEESPAGAVFTLQAEAFPDVLPLRLMLISAGEDGAVLDLGLADVPAQGRLCVTRHCPVELRLWDALSLAEDWPSGRLISAAWLHQPGGPMWRLAEAAARFLAVPVEAPATQ